MSQTKYYECMFLVDSSKYDADPDATVQYLLDLVQKAGGTVAVHRPWQNAKLAYGIRFNRTIHTRGLHYLICFTSEDSDTIDRITYTCHVAQEGIVIRHLTIAHPKALFDPLVESLMGGEGFAGGQDEEIEARTRPERRTEDDVDGVMDEEEEEVTTDA